MKLSFIAVVLASLSAVAFAQIRTSMELGETNYLEADDPVYMNKRGEIVPASNVARSQYLDFVKRNGEPKKRQIDESIAVKTDPQGIILLRVGGRELILGDVVPFSKRGEPVILEVKPGTGLHQPVKMDAFGNIVPAK